MSNVQVPSNKKVTPVKTPRTKEVKAASKPAEILTAREEKGYVYEGSGKSLVKIATEGLKAISATELIASDKSWHTFSLGILAGKLDKEIVQAAAADKNKRPKGSQPSAIRDIFKGVDKARLAALKDVLLVSREELSKAWNGYLNSRTQKSPISIYGLQNALRWMAKEQAGGNTKEKARPIKEALKGVIGGMRSDELLKLPAALYDLLAEYELLPEIEEAQTAPVPKTKAKKKTVADVIDEMEEDEALAA